MMTGGICRSPRQPAKRRSHFAAGAEHDQGAANTLHRLHQFVPRPAQDLIQFFFGLDGPRQNLGRRRVFHGFSLGLSMAVGTAHSKRALSQLVALAHVIESGSFDEVLLLPIPGT